MTTRGPLPLPFRTALLTTTLLILSAAGRAATPDPQGGPPRWWFGAEGALLGVASRPDSSRSSIGVRLGFEGGLQLSRHARIGLLLDWGALNGARCPPDDFWCTSPKHDFNHQYLTLVMQPGNKGWMFQLSGGRAAYEKRSDALYGGSYVVDNPDGWGMRLGFGHERPFRTDRYVGWRVSVDRSNPGQLSAGRGSSAHTTFALSATVGFH